jgi:hypothetical protein
VDDSQNLLSVSRIGRRVVDLCCDPQSLGRSSQLSRDRESRFILKSSGLKSIYSACPEQGMQANAGKLAIIVLVYLKLWGNIKSLSVRT